MGVFSDWLLYIKTSCWFFYIKLLPPPPSPPPHLSNYFCIIIDKSFCLCFCVVLEKTGGGMYRYTLDKFKIIKVLFEFY